MKRLVPLLLVCALVTGPLISVSTAQEGPAWATWWDADWSFRVPVRVPDHVQLPDGSPGSIPETWPEVPVAVELDLTDLLLDNGWPEDPDRPGRPLGFTLDTGSFRVIPYDSFAPGANPTGDPIDVVAFEGAVVSGNAPPGHEVWTLVWNAGPPFPKQVIVYFDRTEAGVKPPLDVDPVKRASIEQSMFRVGFGQRVVGLVPASTHDSKGVWIAGASSSPTEVSVQYSSTSSPAPQDLTGCNGRTVSVTQWAFCDGPSSTAPTDFFVIEAEADQPIAVGVGNGATQGPLAAAGFQIPAVEGGSVGTQFPYVPLTRQGPLTNHVVVIILDDEPCGGACTISAGQDQVSATALAPALVEVTFPTMISTGGAPAVAFALGRGAIVGAGAHGGNVGPTLFLPACIDAAGSDTRCPLSGVATPDGGAAVERIVLDTGRKFALSTPGAKCGALPCALFTGQGMAERFTTDAPMVAVRSVYWEKADRVGAYVPILHSGPRTAVLPVVYEDSETCVARLGIVSWNDISDVTIRNLRRGTDDLRLQAGQLQSWDIAPGGHEQFSLPPQPAEAGETVGLYEISSSTPVSGAAYTDCSPGGTSQLYYGGFLPAQAAPVVGEVGDLEFIGPFLSTTTTPPIVLAQPGDAVSATLTLEGGVRTLEGRVDPLDVTASNPVPVASADAFPEPPVLNIERTSFTLQGGQVETRVTAALPERVNEDELPSTIEVRVPLTAGEGATRVAVNATFAVTVDVTHDFTLTFDDGSVDASLAIDPGDDRSVPLVLTNTGGADESIRMLLRTPVLPGWEIGLRADQRTLRSGSTVDLPKDGEVPLSLDLSPPETPSSVVFQIVVEGVSESDIKLKRAATLTVLFNTNATFVFKDDNDVCPTYDPFRPCPLLVPPGTVETRNLTIENLGTAISLDLSLALSGRGFNAGFATDEGIQDNLTVVLGPRGSLNDRAEVAVVVNASSGLAVGARATALVQARSTPQPGLPQVSAPPLPLPLLAAAVHAVQLDEGPHLVLPGGDERLAVPVTNLGNLDESFEVRLLDVPAGWTVEPVNATLTVLEDATAELDLAVDTPPGTAAGLYPLSVLFVPADGAAGVEAALVLRVFEGPVYRIEQRIDTSLVVGSPRTYRLDVTNQGNDASPVPVTMQAPPGLDVEIEPTTLALPPGGNDTINLTITPNQGGAFPARLVIGANELPLDLTAGTVDLAVVGVSVSGTQPLAVVARVANNGDVPARNVRVDLVANDEVRDTEAIASLAPGTEVTIGLSYANEDEPDDVRVLASLPGGHNDPTPGDNGAVVDVGGSLLPGPALVHVLALVGLAAAALRRRWDA